MNLANQVGASLPASMEGRWVVLRPVAKADYPLFFRWRADVREFHLWSSQRRMPTFEEFTGEMDQLLRHSVTFLVESKRAGHPAGFVQAYNLNLAEGWCFALVYVTKKFRRGHGAEAYAFLIDYLFRTFPLRKVYVDVYEFNDYPIKGLLGAGMVEEGRFREHTWFNDQYWDVFRYAFYRDAWYRYRDRTNLILGVSAELSESVEDGAQPQAAGFIPQDPTGAAIDGDGHST
jgi:RimJ/RimL family protein N-acetyltransferase